MSDKNVTNAGTWGKESCPVCSELVTMHPGGRGSHIRNCALKNGAECPEEYQVKPKPANPLKDVKPVEVRNPKLQQDIAAAESMNKRLADDEERRRKEAPDAVATVEHQPDALKKLVAYARDMGVIADTETTYFGENKEHRFQISKGYIPVVDPRTGEHMGHNELLLYKRAEILKQREQESYEAESRRRLRVAAKSGMKRDDDTPKLETPGSDDSMPSMDQMQPAAVAS